MKKSLSLTLFFLSFLAYPISGANNSEFTPKQYIVCDESKHSLQINDSEDIIKFFFNSINGVAKEKYSKANPINIKDIDKVKEQVWTLWKEANHIIDEDKLLPLADLSKDTRSIWELPKEGGMNTLMPFFYGKKGELTTEKGFPLYIYMHGSGAKGREWSNGLYLANFFKDSPSVYFIPQIPHEGEYYRWWQRSKQYAWNKLIRLAMISDYIDVNKIYMFGISEGGYGSQRLASFYADYLAGAGPMAGGEPLKNAPVENCKNIAFSLRTGELDYGFYRNKLTKYTKEAFSKMKEKYPDSFTNFIELRPNEGHTIDYSLTTPWLKQYVREPQPKHFLWEDFEMDGVHRSGFYNIYVDERPDNDKRTFYEMSIKSNNIYINVSNIDYTTTETDSQFGIALAFKREYTPAKSGRFTLYLSDKLVDLNKKVTVYVNGKKVFKGKLDINANHLINSCAAFYDRERLFPAAINIDLSRYNKD